MSLFWERFCYSGGNWFPYTLICALRHGSKKENQDGNRRGVSPWKSSLNAVMDRLPYVTFHYPSALLDMSICTAADTCVTAQNGTNHKKSASAVPLL